MAKKIKLGGPRKIFLNPGYKCNHLTVLYEVEGRRYKSGTKRIKRQYMCQCDCGNRVIVLLDRLIRGNAVSCGCKRSFKHIDRTCKICGKKFSTGRTLNHHMAAIHGDVGYKYICTSCHKEFMAKRGFRFGSLVRCPDCRRNVVHFKEHIESLLQMSKRTVAKVLKRVGAKCSMCGWCEASCDVHHIIPKSKGGSDTNDNLVILCPNCHRKVHDGVATFTEEEMKHKAVSTQWGKFIDAYHPSN